MESADDTAADANNNTPSVTEDKRKYSLRPRNSLRVGRYSPEVPATLTESLQSIEAEHHPSKPAPLSKYRRKTANARERDRMREINAAFETLRRAVPSPELSHGCNEKLTKITTLRLAMRYITELRTLLDNEPATLPPLPGPPVLHFDATFPEHSMLTPPDFHEHGLIASELEQSLGGLADSLTDPALLTPPECFGDLTP